MASLSDVTPSWLQILRSKKAARDRSQAAFFFEPASLASVGGPKPFKLRIPSKLSSLRIGDMKSYRNLLLK